MVSSISFGATFALFLSAVHARALPQVQPQASPQQQQTPAAQAPSQIGAITAGVYSAMRNNPNEPNGVLISIPYQTTTVTVTANIAAFTSAAVPQGPAQSGNGLIGNPQTQAIPTPSSIPAGVFPPGYATAGTGGLLPFMPSGTGSGYNPMATGAFISAVMPGIQASVASEVQSLLNPLATQLSAATAVTTPQAIAPTQPVAQQQPVTITVQNVQTVQVPTTIVQSIQVPTTIVQSVQVPTTVVNTVPVPTTISQATTVTQPVTVTVSNLVVSTPSAVGNTVPVPFASNSAAPFPFPSGIPSGSLATGALPTGTYPSGTGVSPSAGLLPSGTGSVSQSTPAAIPQPLSPSVTVPQPSVPALQPSLSTPAASPVVPASTPASTPVSSGSSSSSSSGLSSGLSSPPGASTPGGSFQAIPGSSFSQGIINR